MTEVKVSPNPDGLTIKLIGVGEDKANLLESFEGCASGECACSPTEFQKVESMKIGSDEDSISIEVKSKAGEVIDPACVTECISEMENNSEVNQCK